MIWSRGHLSRAQSRFSAMKLASDHSRATARCLKCRHFGGFATREGTQSFLSKEGADLPLLHHHFEVSGLFVNPIIHGPPLRQISSKKQQVYMLQALCEHKSNAFFVYDHYTGTYGSRLQKEEGGCESWSADSFNDILAIAGHRREEIVVIAGLGRMSAGMDFVSTLSERIAEARAKSGVGNIDYALIEFDSSSFSQGGDVLDDAVIALETLCRGHNVDGAEQKLQGYGIHLAVEPYVFHNPARSKSGPLAVLPSMVESAIGLKHYEEGQLTPSHAEMMVYTCSPSITVPATYPMLEPPPEVWNNALIEPQMDTDLDKLDLNEEERTEAEIMKRTVRALSEEGRRFSRLAMNPLHIFRGAGAGAGAEMEGGDELQQEEEGEEESIDYLREVSEQWEASHLKEEQEQEQEVEEGEGRNSKEGGGDGGSMSLAPATFGAPMVLLQSPYRDPNRQARTAAGRAVALKRQSEEAAVGAALDELCPPLGDGHSPLLQEKALRAVMSVGFDAVVLDAESSAHFGRLAVPPEALLRSIDTDNLFGHFEVPASASGK